jgi:hypothetical protein
LPRRSHDRRVTAAAPRRRLTLDEMKAQVSQGAAGCIALHELGEIPGDHRPFLVMASRAGACPRCDAIRARQRSWDLAHLPPAPPITTNTEDTPW